MRQAMGRWSNESVQRFAGDRDPVAAMRQHARTVVVDAFDRGWSGPPFNPVALADLLNLKVRPTEDVLDARVVSIEDTFRIEYNPNRSRGRVHYSIAHEIAHTFFEDCGETTRHRLNRTEAPPDEWQLEALCNIGAAEILMPQESLGPVEELELQIERIRQLRKNFAVSTEAILIRVAELAQFSGGVFAASRAGSGQYRGRYRLDYIVPSADWAGNTSRVFLPRETVLAGCTGIGYTATGQEKWPLYEAPLRIEAMAVPPYPGSAFPRVVGLFVEAEQESASVARIDYVRGDALKPRGSGPAIIAHVANDRTPRWGGGFALEVRRRLPEVQQDFISWAEHPDALTLGRSRLFEVNERLSVASLVAQKGYGPSTKPRVRYQALRTCLRELAVFAGERDAEVHMPRIGAGEGGGSWSVLESLILENLVREGVAVTVYTLPDAEAPEPSEQGDLQLFA